jgi:hypothetical protein
MGGSPYPIPSPLRTLCLATAPTDIAARPTPIAVFAKTNTPLTDAAQGGFVGGRIFQSLDVVLLGAHIHIELRCKHTTAWLSRLPLAPVAFIIVETTQGKAARVVVTAVSGVGKELIGRGVITNPVLATLGLSQPIAVAAQTTAPARRDE